MRAHIEIHNSILNDGQQSPGESPPNLHNVRTIGGASAATYNFSVLVLVSVAQSSKKRKDELSISECLRSLHFQDYQTRRLNVSERDPCTFEWIWKHPAFVKWENSPSSSLLWLQGKPASGKSTLMKYIRMDLDNRLSTRIPKMHLGELLLTFSIAIEVEMPSADTNGCCDLAVSAIEYAP
ncbi:hypothetical protein BDD12DRAFT_914824 [Trichophaea hybrida]|nr:hypothetical protein BDD12DRAFT_914824 [Trichophaea hybrida]